MVSMGDIGNYQRLKKAVGHDYVGHGYADHGYVGDIVNLTS